ncbi:glycosyl transferase family 1 [candidate division KSB3 bacterium]|uniref:Glycosyl transferase family 1 n=1 Tax=candidate division KSB3 bacterium TaxID=2044937 RepID=A0A2G6KMN1_9BACT|nr:MAG: glycosyl transferase family 1 [candidate division KSB3 bacterium]
MLTRKIHNVGFISTRLKGTDGVSLETAKWSTVLERMGYTCYFFAGLSDWDAHRTTVVPEAFFDHHRIRDIQSQCFGVLTRSSELSGEIHHLRMHLKQALYDFVKDHEIGLIIPQNAVTIPMNIPLGVAITEFIAETGIPTIAHHHDFYWERQRFMINCVSDFLSLAFPPSLPSIQHVVINTPADREMSYRTGLSPHVIPNVLHFEDPAPGIDDYNKDVRADLGLEEDDIFFLQPTRIVARKGIEHAIEIVNRLKNPKVKLVISHEGGDEGVAYEERIRNYAEIMHVPLIIRPDIIGGRRGQTPEGKKIYTLWDIYPHADLITYPSMYEGFGNAFLEALYFKKPIVVNRYSIYESDIEPMGFDVVTMDGYVTPKVIEQIEYLLSHPADRDRMAEKNYQIALQFFSYEVLAYKLMTIMIRFEGLSQYASP